MDLDKLGTESVHPDSIGIHEKSALEIVELINREDRKVAEAAGEELVSIARIVEMAAERLGNGGRMFYVGCGTSGRLGVLDASECPPTFGVDPELVQGVIAGGEKALVKSSEGMEDDPETAGRDLEARGCCEKDLVIGISASGRTPYVIGALQWARERGIATAAIACNRPAEHDAFADTHVNVVCGPEVVSGSTRMKSGTAQKMVLNMISTGTMVRLGHVRDGRMINVRATNVKLRERAARIIMDAAGVDQAAAEAALDEHEGDVEAAINSLQGR